MNSVSIKAEEVFPKAIYLENLLHKLLAEMNEDLILKKHNKKPV